MRQNYSMVDMLEKLPLFTSKSFTYSLNCYINKCHFWLCAFTSANNLKTIFINSLRPFETSRVPENKNQIETSFAFSSE